MPGGNNYVRANFLISFDIPYLSFIFHGIAFIFHIFAQEIQLKFRKIRFI